MSDRRDEDDLLRSPDPEVRSGAARALSQRTRSRAVFTRLLEAIEQEADARVLKELARALRKHASRSNAELLIGRMWKLSRGSDGPRQRAAQALLREVGAALGWTADRVKSAGERYVERLTMSLDTPPPGEYVLDQSADALWVAAETPSSVPLSAPSGPVARPGRQVLDASNPGPLARASAVDPVDRARELVVLGDRVQAIAVLQEAVRANQGRAPLAAAWAGALLLSAGQDGLAADYLAMIDREPKPTQTEMEKVRAFCRDRGLVPLPRALRERRESAASLSELTTPSGEKAVDAIELARQQLTDRFAGVELIGTGGMGVVFRAHDTELDRDVAIKMIAPDHWNDPRALKRFVLEARALARVSHPAVLRIHDIHRGEVPFFTMELLEGHPLEALLANGVPPPALLIRHLIPVLEALEHCHEAGLIHRDVKPRNIFLTAAGDVRLMDFGIVKSAGATSMTRAGTIVGTPRYMAPEQLLGTRIDRRVDVYAFGVTLFQMLTGVLPFRDPGEVFARPTPNVRDWVDVAPELAAVVERCLKRSPDDRYQSCRELIEALRPFVDAPPPAKAAGLTARDVFSAVMGECLKDRALAGVEKPLIFAVRRLLGISAEVHQEVFREVQARVRAEPVPAISPDALYRLIVRCHFKDPAPGPELGPVLEEIGRLLELARPRRRQLERELAEELRIEASLVPGGSDVYRRPPR